MGLCLLLNPYLSNVDNLFFFEAALVPETPSLSYQHAEDPINEEDKDELVEEFSNVLIDSFKSSDCGFHVFSDKDKNVKYEIKPDGVVASIETNIYPFVEKLLEASCGFKVDMYPLSMHLHTFFFGFGSPNKS